MKLVLPTWPGLAVLFILSGAVGATEIYQWVGADGKTHFGDVPPSDATSVKQVSRKVGIGGTVPSVNSRADAPSDTDEQPGIEATLASGDECAYKRQQLVSFKSAISLVETDALGREREYTAEERGQIVRKIEREMALACNQAESE